MKTNAYWDGSLKVYVCAALNIISADGDEWCLENGEPADGQEFDNVAIILLGGPRDGDIVA